MGTRTVPATIPAPQPAPLLAPQPAPLPAPLLAPLTGAFLVAALVTAAGLTACAPPDDGPGASMAAVSIDISEPEHLIPSDTVERDDTQVVTVLWTPLVTLDPNGTATMAAAESVHSVDHRTWTVRLKPGWTFHNGEPVTPTSYVNAWNYAAYGPNAQSGQTSFERVQGYSALQSVDGVTAPAARRLAGLSIVDDRTLTVTLSAPFGDFARLLGGTAFAPLPAAAFDRQGRVTDHFEQAPVGQGPFQMYGRWKHNQTIAVRAYGGYQGTKPKVSAIDFRLRDDPHPDPKPATTMTLGP